MLNLQTPAPSLKTLAALGAAALLALPLAAPAQHVYRCPGPDGRTIFTDKPCDGARLRINNKGLGTSVKHDTQWRTSPRKKAAAPAAAPASAAPAASAPASAPAPEAAPQVQQPQSAPQTQGVQL